MKRFSAMMIAGVIVPLVLWVTIAGAALPFGPGVKNGNAAYTKLYADSLIVGGAYVGGGITAAAVSDSLDAVRATIPLIPATWSTGLPVYPDTVQTAKDSLTVMSLADVITLPTEYATYLHAFGNASPAADSLFMIGMFSPKDTDPDSVYWYVKASAGIDSASYGVVVSQKAAATDAPFVQQRLGATLMNTWERKAYAFLDFNAGDYAVTIRIRLTHAASINISPIYFK